MRKSLCYLVASVLTLALSACSTTSVPLTPVQVVCEPLPATLRVRPRPLPPLRTTLPDTQANGM